MKMNKLQEAYHYYQLADHRYNCYIDAGNKHAGYLLNEYRYGYSNIENDKISSMPYIDNEEYIEQQMMFYSKLAEEHQNEFISDMLKFIKCIDLDKVTDNELRELVDAYPDDFYVLGKFFKTLNIYNIKDLI